MKRLFLKACVLAAAGALLEACGGGSTSDSGGGGGGSGGGGGGGTTTDSLLQRVQQDANFTTLRAAVEKAQLQSTLDGSGASLTLFAPGNSAFDALAVRFGLGDGSALVATLSVQQWRDILNFNVLSQAQTLADLNAQAVNDDRPATLFSFRGETARLILVIENGQLNVWGGIGRTVNPLTRSDVAASNGVLHVISELLLPRGVLNLSQTLLSSVDGFARFGAEMTRLGITDLAEPGPFTLFSPIDAAVAPPLSAATWRNHVVRGELDSDSFLQPTSPAAIALTTLSGRQLTLRRGSGAPGAPLATLSDSMGVLAGITDVDFFASNGVTHTINGVLVIR